VCVCVYICSCLLYSFPPVVRLQRHARNNFNQLPEIASSIAYVNVSVVDIEQLYLHIVIFSAF